MRRKNGNLFRAVQPFSHGLFLKRHFSRNSTTKSRRYEVSQRFVFSCKKNLRLCGPLCFCAFDEKASQERPQGGFHFSRTAVTSSFYSHSFWTTHCPVHGEVRLRAATSVSHLKCRALNAVTGTGRLLDPEKCFPFAATLSDLLEKQFAGNVGADVDRRGP